MLRNRVGSDFPGTGGDARGRKREAGAAAAANWTTF